MNRVARFVWQRKWFVLTPALMVLLLLGLLLWLSTSTSVSPFVYSVF